ncbi:hypothetical protein LZ31DRAFT_81127 [Colletotrichum somersetense]|nr:hypothetical protein LZ31DRAFT_81127 [Colletotrichum somersetense]
MEWVVRQRSIGLQQSDNLISLELGRLGTSRSAQPLRSTKFTPQRAQAAAPSLDRDDLARSSPAVGFSSPPALHRRPTHDP